MSGLLVLSAVKLEHDSNYILATPGSAAAPKYMYIHMHTFDAI